jgi:hypothetical protein
MLASAEIVSTKEGKGIRPSLLLLCSRTRQSLVRIYFNRQQKLSVKEGRSSSLRSQATPRYLDKVFNKSIVSQRGM